MIDRRDIIIKSKTEWSSITRRQDSLYKLELLQDHNHHQAMLRSRIAALSSRLLIYVIADSVKNLGHPVLSRDSWAWLASDQLACDLLQCSTAWSYDQSETLGSLQAKQYSDIILLRPTDSSTKFTATKIIDYSWHSHGSSKSLSLKQQIELEQGCEFRPDQDTEFYQKGTFTDLCHALWNLNLLLEISYFGRGLTDINGADLP